MVDPVLLLVNGFDASAQRFNYQVNPRFGDSRPIAAGLQNPFRLSLYVTFDVNRPSAELRAALLLRPLRGTSSRPSADSIFARTQRRTGGPAFMSFFVLNQADSLLLSAEQIQAVRRVSAERNSTADSAYHALAKNLAELPDTYDLAEVARLIQATTDLVGGLAQQKEMAFLREILTPLQQRLLPSVFQRR